jgi:N-acetylmuramoyl-L-alanine amidase
VRIAISSGHGLHIRGARGNPVPPQLDEVDEARKMVEQIADDLRARGVTVMTFHDDVSNDQGENLNRIVDWHNSQTRELDISQHFNAYDGSAHGTECLFVTQEQLAGKVASAIASAGKFTNRGPQYRSDLFFLNNTEEPAILIETCFCDNTSDSNLYRENFAAICDAIASSISGQAGTSPPDSERPPIERPPATEEVVVDVQIYAPPGVRVDVTVNKKAEG